MKLAYCSPWDFRLCRVAQYDYFIFHFFWRGGGEDLLQVYSRKLILTHFIVYYDRFSIDFFMARAAFKYANFIDFQLLLSSGPDGRLRDMHRFTGMSIVGRIFLHIKLWRTMIYQTNWDPFISYEKTHWRGKGIQIYLTSQGPYWRSYQFEEQPNAHVRGYYFMEVLHNGLSSHIELSFADSIFL